MPDSLRQFLDKATKEYEEKQQAKKSKKTKNREVIKNEN
jgi:hypothetical protein